MVIGIVVGVFLVAVGIVEYRRAVLLLFDRWHTLQPRDWSRTMRSARRIFPFGSLIKSQIVNERLTAWRWSPPAWIGQDPTAMKLFRRVRLAPVVLVIGIMVIAIAVVLA